MHQPITAEDRAAFKVCRRQWDFGAPRRRSLEPTAPPPVPDVQRALKDALAVYYFPGMWDWPRPIVLPLVVQAYERSVTGQREGVALEPATEEAWGRAEGGGRAALDAYLTWAPTVDAFSPVQVEVDVVAVIADPDDPERSLLGCGARPAEYQARVDLLAVDADDAYWVVQHRVGADWTAPVDLILDEEPVAACWAWEDAYLGMEIAGTIHNELRLTGAHDRRPGAATSDRGGLDQNEASGGGRSVPQHRRMYLPPRTRQPGGWVTSREAGPLRRTVIRRAAPELERMGARIGREAREMLRSDLALYPSPAADRCPSCPFRGPCVALTVGEDPEPLLRERFRERTRTEGQAGRLGAKTWSIGRGAAPGFGRDR